MDENVVLKTWVLSPWSTRQYPPGTLGRRMDKYDPVYDDGFALVELEYVERVGYTDTGWTLMKELVDVPSSELETV